MRPAAGGVIDPEEEKRRKGPGANRTRGLWPWPIVASPAH